MQYTNLNLIKQIYDIVHRMKNQKEKRYTRNKLLQYRNMFTIDKIIFF